MALNQTTREETIRNDIHTARQVLRRREDQISEIRLEDGIRSDWETLRQARELDAKNLKGVARTIIRHIRQNKGAAMALIPAPVLANIEHQLETGTKPDEVNLDIFKLLAATNKHVAEHKENIDESHLEALALIKKTVAEQIRLVLDAKKGEQDRQTLAFDHEINDAIDYETGNESLESTITSVMSHLRKKLGAEVIDIKFYLVNEDNHYQQSDNLTAINSDGTSSPLAKTEFEERKKTKLFTDPKVFIRTEGNTVFVELKINDRYQGVMEIELNPGTQLNSQQIAYINQTRLRLDTKIDQSVRERKMMLLDEIAHDILEEGKSPSQNFEQSLARLMKEICLYSKATRADLLLVVTDEETDGHDKFIAKQYSDDHEPQQLANTNAMRRFATEQTAVDDQEKGRMVKDILDPNSKKVIGKIIFRTDNLEEMSDEDRNYLGLASMIIASHAAEWRGQMRLKVDGFDPKIAAAEMNEGIEDINRDEATTILTDISGFTRICHCIEDKLCPDEESKDEASKIILGLVQNFLGSCQRIAYEYGGTWDKGIGDMAMIHFGVPRDKASGKDPLGYGREQFHPEFYAMNALKASLLIQNELGKISTEFRNELLQIAKKKFTPPKIEENDEWAKYLMDEEQWYIDRLREEIGISTTIDTTQVVGTHKAAFAKVALGSSHDYTRLGTGMNQEARRQGKARRNQTLIPRRTRNLIKDLIESNSPVPYQYSHKTGERKSETFNDFLSKKLGLNPASIKAFMTEEYSGGFKNLDGSDLSYSFQLKDTEGDLPKKGSKLDRDGLASYDKQEFAIRNIRDTEGKTKLNLVTIPINGKPRASFTAEIPQGSIEETVTIYVSRDEYQQRKTNGSNTTLLVQDSRFTRFTYSPLGDLQNKQLKEALDNVEGNALNHKNTPSGCYRVVTSSMDGARRTLELKKGKYIFETNYRNSRIKKGLEAISSQDEVFHDFKAYLGEIYGEIKSDSGQSIIFVHKGEYYEVDVNELQGLVEEIKKQITQSNPPDDMVTSGRTPTTMPPVSMKPRG